jgi:hypothetical protein
MASEDRTCRRGHSVAEADPFCSTCGARMERRVPRGLLIPLGSFIAGGLVVGGIAVALGVSNSEAAAEVTQPLVLEVPPEPESVEVEAAVEYTVSEPIHSPVSPRCGRVPGVGYFDGLTEFEVRDTSGVLVDRGQITGATPANLADSARSKAATCTHHARFSVPDGGGPYSIQVGDLQPEDYLLEDLKDGVTIRVLQPID